MKRLYTFLLALLLGIALLYEALHRYTAAADRRDNPGPPIGTTARSTPQPHGLRPPEQYELDGLEDPDPSRRGRLAEVLMDREYTPELIRRVDDRLAQNQPAPVEEKLRCLKAHFPGEENLDLAMRLVPADDPAHPDPLRRSKVECQLKAIAEHGREDPDRVRAALIAYAFSQDSTLRYAATNGLKNLPPADEIPVDVRLGVASTDPIVRSKAIAVAMTIGSVSAMPSLVERALDDPEPGIRAMVRARLQSASDEASARIMARGIARHSRDAEWLRSLRARDVRAHADVSSALAALALDPSVPVEERLGALDALRGQGDVGVLPMIAPLRRDGDAVMSASAQAAGLELEQRQSRGVPSGLLPPAGAAPHR
jgi:hypothetical protein